MAYDRDSFLAGIAAGRNMKSWPVLMESGSSVFAFTFQGSSISLLFRFKGIIMWGDGLSNEVDFSAKRGAIYHNYDGSGQYQVIFIGKMWSFPVSTLSYDRQRIISIDTPFPPYPDPVSVDSPHIISVENTDFRFSNCVRLQSIPDGLMRNWAIDGILVSAMNGMFDNCRALTTVPENTFDDIKIYVDNVQDRTCLSMFSGAGVDAGIFRIPEGLFKNPEFSQVKSLNNIFFRAAIASIPENLFSQFTGVTSANYAFALCEQLTSIPYRLFDGIDEIQTFISTFWGGSGITSSVPPLWIRYPNANGGSCFSGCVNAANFANIPASWGGPDE